MDGMLSQEEINALLGASSAGNSTSGSDNTLTPQEKDAIGEISNICMGTAATTLYSLVNQKVLITTPFVEVKDWNTLMNQYSEPCVLIDILYKEGIDGSNLLLLKEHDVKVITDLMMGGDGLNPQDELSELHFSAIGEAMNQMMGSSATSLSSLLKCKIDISPPEAKLVQLSEDFEATNAAGFMEKDFVQVTFRMTIGDLVDSEIMQLYPIEFAKTLYDRFNGGDNTPEEVPKTDATAAQPATQHEQGQAIVQPTMNNQTMGQPMMNNPMMGQPMMMAQPEVNVQNVQFKSFTPSINPILQQENIDLIMDVPLEVSAVLGRTRKSIKDILEFAPGKIIELDKLAGEPIDIMVNQKLVAKGEVVVIEESFGIRITEIIKDKL